MFVKFDIFKIIAGAITVVKIYVQENPILSYVLV